MSSKCFVLSNRFDPHRSLISRTALIKRRGGSEGPVSEGGGGEGLEEEEAVIQTLRYGGSLQNVFFGALWASVWSKNKGFRPKCLT